MVTAITATGMKKRIKICILNELTGLFGWPWNFLRKQSAYRKVLAVGSEVAHRVARRTVRRWRPFTHGFFRCASSVLFGDDAVSPFDQRNESGRIAELRVPIRKIVFRDPTGPGASSSSKDMNVFGDYLFAQLAERRPTNGNHRV